MIQNPEEDKVTEDDQRKKPTPITGLAKVVGRDRRNVVSDLRYLEGLGLVEVEAKRRKKMPKNYK